MLATVVGQDLETGPDGAFRIARRVAKDRVISTVDPETRHGHKTPPAGSMATRATSGWTLTGRSSPAPRSPRATPATPASPTSSSRTLEPTTPPWLESSTTSTTPTSSTTSTTTAPARRVGGWRAAAGQVAVRAKHRRRRRRRAGCVYGDNAYGTGGFRTVSSRPASPRCKTQTPTAAGGLFSKDRFDINLGADLGAGAVTCPGGVTAPIRPARAGGGTAYFASACSACPLRAQCTTAAGGRTVSVGPYEQTLTDARARQTDPSWVTDYRATRPKVERKLGHLVRRHHGGRRARVRGTARVDADFRLLAGAVNLARLAVLGLRGTAQGWAVAA